MADPFLRVEGVSKRYLPRGLSRHRPQELPPVLRAVSFDLARGRLLGLVGASGSGKTTLARCLALADPPDSGRVLFEGCDLWASGRRERAALRARIQLIPQQPAASLNPRFTAAEVISEPLAIQRRGTAAERRRMAGKWMERLGLAVDAGDKRALEFSGGERQRLAIARALVLEPVLLILDESFAGLDVSVQGHISRLMREMCAQGRLSAIVITHDLALAASLADEIAVMDGGALVECGPAQEVVAHPRHARTRELLDAAMALSLEEPA
jgi:peptide/nickel transport system ATP-binding protein